MEGYLKRIVGLLLSVIVFTVPVFAKPIYVIKKNDGSILITNRTPPKGVKAVIYNPKKTYNYRSMNGLNPVYNTNDSKLFVKYCDLIKRFAVYYNVSESLIRSVIHVESLYNPYAVSRKGAQGLMQLMPYVSKNLGVGDPFLPEQNIQGGTRLLAKLLKKYHGNRILALAAYNAGEGAVDRFNGVPPYKETRNYVKKVLALQTRYAMM